MKTLFFSLFVLLSFQSFAADRSVDAQKNQPAFSRKYGMAGCGLGSMLFEPTGSQILAATTNGSTFNQLFGITFGTLNCEGGSLFSKADNMDRFIQGNKVVLADDIARGNGETIQALASLMGCKGSQTELNSLLQSQFSAIFSRHDIEANFVTDNIITVIGNDKALSKACNINI